MARRLLLLYIGLLAEIQLSVLNADAPVPLATDPECPEASCCDVGSDLTRCWSRPMWTAAYCCPRGPASDCYRWGEDAPGFDLESYEGTSSAVQCRHLCQAHERCAFWTYLVNVPELLNLRATCFLKSDGALHSRIKSHAYVVSGERLCNYFAEGLSPPRARARRGITSFPWRTASNEVSSAAFREQNQFSLLSAAGRPDWHIQAAEVFSTYGFVAILDAFIDQDLAELRPAAKAIAEQMIALDPTHIGNRGPRRYSFGGASNNFHLMHVKQWPRILDNGPTSIVMREIFPAGYLAVGGGGDFVLPHTSTYQSLHLDIGGGPIYDVGGPPAVAINVVLENLSCADAPMRVLPLTHVMADQPPPLPWEPLEAKQSLLCPLPAGTAIVRDLRAWHGGTPNGSNRTRYMPNGEFVSIAWGQLVCGTGALLDPCRPLLPQAAHDELSAFGKAITENIVDKSAVMQDPLDASASDWSWLNPRFASISRHGEHHF